MKFTLLAARISAGRKLRQKIQSEFTANKLRGKDLGINTSQPGTQAGRDHLARQRIRRDFPYWEYGFKPGIPQLGFPVGAHVHQKQVAKGNRLHSFRHRLAAKPAHGVFVFLV